MPEYTVNPGDIMIKFSAPEELVVRSVRPKVTEKVTDNLPLFMIRIALRKANRNLFLCYQRSWGVS